MPTKPVTKEISHIFGENRGIRRHNGIDYKVDPGTPVKASADGIVVRSTMHEPSERIVLKKQVNNMGEKEKKFFGSYGNVIIIYHGQGGKKLKHTYTLYAHLDHRSVRANEKVREGQMIATAGRSGTRQGFYNHKGGYELHFEVLQSKEELKWVKGGDLDLQFAEEHWRIDPERFFRRSFKVVFADELVKEALGRLKKERLDISKLAGKWVKFATKSGYVGVTAMTPVVGPLGVKGGVYFKPSDETAYVSLGVGLFTSSSINVVYSRDELSTLSRGAYGGPLDISEGFKGIPGPLTKELGTSATGAGIYFEITLPVPPGPTQPFNFYQFGRF